MNKLCVIGGLNRDMTGGNQAVAAARLGADVSMIGCVGDDANGQRAINVLQEQNVNTQGIKLLPADANGALTTDIITELKPILGGSDACLFSLDAPMVSLNHAAALAKREGKIVILNPTPAQPVPEALLILCDYVTPNEAALQCLTGMPVGTIDGAVLAARELLKKGAHAVLSRRDAQGALLVTRDGYRLFPGYAVHGSDVTFADDAFNAALAAGLVMGFAPDDAVYLANAVYALATTAQGAMPSLDQAVALVESMVFIEDQP